jgi:metal-dependent HD superfamily phosphatase/phosphodiesterase
MIVLLAPALHPLGAGAHRDAAELSEQEMSPKILYR